MPVLSDICYYFKGKTLVAELNSKNYISTENMLPNKGGICDASALPNAVYTQAFEEDDILVSNIRPYFKKIWRASFSGGCSNDVLVFRANEKCVSEFLYYILSDNEFFNYSMGTSKGTKMPRGDKQSIMRYEIGEYSIDIQKKIASILSSIDEKIRANQEINKNLSLLVA